MLQIFYVGCGIHKFQKRDTPETPTWKVQTMNTLTTHRENPKALLNGDSAPKTSFYDELRHKQGPGLKSGPIANLAGTARSVSREASGRIGACGTVHR